ncbi:unnamed protein product [Amoebophrya sp. A120]|nr:unnamed protein product [Amoebophrya sp. A120]|eukprot:GSA120T00000709001.1
MYESDGSDEGSSESATSSPPSASDHNNARLSADGTKQKSPDALVSGPGPEPEVPSAAAAFLQRDVGRELVQKSSADHTALAAKQVHQVEETTEGGAAENLAGMLEQEGAAPIFEDAAHTNHGSDHLFASSDDHQGGSTSAASSPSHDLGRGAPADAAEQEVSEELQGTSAGGPSSSTSTFAETVSGKLVDDAALMLSNSTLKLVPDEDDGVEDKLSGTTTSAEKSQLQPQEQSFVETASGPRPMLGRALSTPLPSTDRGDAPVAAAGPLQRTMSDSALLRTNTEEPGLPWSLVGKGAMGAWQFATDAANSVSLKSEKFLHVRDVDKLTHKIQQQEDVIEVAGRYPPVQGEAAPGDARIRKGNCKLKYYRSLAHPHKAKKTEEHDFVVFEPLLEVEGGRTPPPQKTTRVVAEYSKPMTGIFFLLYWSASVSPCIFPAARL